MRILQLTSHLNVGGITRYLFSLCERLVPHQYQVVIASDGGSAEDAVTRIGVSHWRLPLHTSAEFSPQVWWSIRQLAVRLRQEPVDLIHAHTRVGQVVAEQLAHRFQIPYVTTWHGIYTRRVGRRLWPCTGMRTIAISELVRQHLLTVFRVSPARVRCIYNGVDTAYYAHPPDPAVVEACRQQWRIPAHVPVVGGIGRLAAGRVKGFDTLLVAAALLEHLVPDLQVLIVGDGPRRPFLEDMAMRLGIRSRVHFIGEAQDIRIPLALMDLFVFTSRWPEAFGLTLVEAMAAGKPVVATQAGAVPEVISHDVDGWLVPSDDPSAMADGIARLLHDRAAAMRLGRQAQHRAHEAFDLERMVEQIEQVYEEVAKRPSG
ncbi:MAG: glycosyltransferase family 4 protein [Candidatus Omnitrophica bacterium]|nr:glycosyltransferase family 4 protein [Candidatus Omnitrophota bacterium]